MVAGIGLAAGAWIWKTLVTPVLTAGPGGYGFVNLGGAKLGSVAYTAIAFATGYTLGPGSSEWHVLEYETLWGGEGIALAMGVGALGVLMGIGLTTLLRTQGTSLALSVLAQAVVPPLLVLAASWWTDHAYAPRHVGMSYPFALALAAAGSGHLTRRRLAWLAAALLIGLQAASLWNLHANPRYSREDVRSAARFVAENVGPDDLVLIFGEIDRPWRHYYRGAGAWKKVYPRDRGQADELQLRSDLEGREIVWTVRGRLWRKPGSERLIALVEERSPVLERHEFPGSIMVSRHRLRRGAGGGGPSSRGWPVHSGDGSAPSPGGAVHFIEG
jgi:hypothetical protein